MNSEALWAQGAQQFQQIFGETWQRALQSFQSIETAAPPGDVPALKLAPDKVQALQAQYMEEAGKLCRPPPKSKTAVSRAKAGLPTRWPLSLPPPTCSTPAP